MVLPQPADGSLLLMDAFVGRAAVYDPAWDGNADRRSVVPLELHVRGRRGRGP